MGSEEEGWPQGRTKELLPFRIVVARFWYSELLQLFLRYTIYRILTMTDSSRRKDHSRLKMIEV